MQSHEHTDGDQQGAVDELARHMRVVRERRDSVTDEALRAALTTITDALTHHWSTGGGTRLRRFIWSLWNDWHLDNLYYLCSGLDYTLGDAVLVVFRAQMVGALTEDHKRAVLQQSGEFARWEEARAETPEDEDASIPRWRLKPKTCPVSPAQPNSSRGVWPQSGAPRRRFLRPRSWSTPFVNHFGSPRNEPDSRRKHLH
jgi:hypothetical protein